MMRDRTLELGLGLLPDLKRKRRIGGSRRRGSVGMRGRG
jgi:hypothetical protein